jgi:DNA repair protein RadC
VAASVYHVPIREWPEGERPREKLAQLGAAHLSDAELLAILLRVGVSGEDVVRLAQRLIVYSGGLAGLSKMPVSELARHHGIGPAKAATLHAALELGRRAVLAATGERLQIRSPHDVASLLQIEMGDLEQEHVRVVLLNTKNYVLGQREIYRGSLNSSLIRTAEIFRDAIRENAAAIIVAHNHPSGDPTPSPEDVRVTRDLVAAGQLLGIELLDHLVIGRQCYVSLRERRLGFDV